MLIKHKLSMDFTEGWETPVIRVVQQDSNTRGVEMTLLDKKVPWEVPTGVSAAVGYRKPDGTAGLYSVLPDNTPATTIEKSVVTAIFAPQMLTVPGDVYAVVILQDADLNQLASFPFIVKVKKYPAAGLSISNDYYNFPTLEEINRALRDKFDEVNTVLSQLEEDLAAGKFNGKTPQEGVDYFTDEDKAEMVTAVLARLPSEEWVFTMEDDSTVTKKVAVME